MIFSVICLRYEFLSFRAYFGGRFEPYICQLIVINPSKDNVSRTAYHDDMGQFNHSDKIGFLVAVDRSESLIFTSHCFGVTWSIYVYFIYEKIFL